MLVSFKNTIMNRELMPEDFERLGIDYDGEGVISWAEWNNWSMELPDDVAQKLIEALPDEFMPTPEPEPDDESPNEVEVAPEEAPKESPSD